jgi:hypothetical protein
VLCCAVLCCAVLCCAVLCCAVLCCAVLCCAVLCCAWHHTGMCVCVFVCLRDACIWLTSSRIMHAPRTTHIHTQNARTTQVPELQLPIRFDTDVGGELADSAPGVGRSLGVSFSRCLAPACPGQVRARALVAAAPAFVKGRLE